MGFINIVLSPLDVIFKPIVTILEAVIKMIVLLIQLIKALPKLFSLFTIFTDPAKVLKDVLNGLFIGFKMILYTFIDALTGTAHKKSREYLGKLGKNKKDGEACFAPKFIELLILVLCPPLAVFMRKGISAILIILLTFVLTYFYYIPGLVFGAIQIL